MISSTKIPLHMLHNEKFFEKTAVACINIIHVAYNDLGNRFNEADCWKDQLCNDFVQLVKEI
jgi:hypothetical protein